MLHARCHGCSGNFSRLMIREGKKRKRRNSSFEARVEDVECSYFVLNPVTDVALMFTFSRRGWETIMNRTLNGWAITGFWLPLSSILLLIHLDFNARADQGPLRQLQRDKAQMEHGKGSNIVIATPTHLDKRNFQFFIESIGWFLEQLERRSPK